MKELYEHYKFSNDQYENGDSDVVPDEKPWFVDEYSQYSV